MTSFLPKAGAIWPGLRFRGNGHGSTLQEADDQGAIYLQDAVVVGDEAFLPEPIHEFTYPCAGVPTISARVAWLTFRGYSGFDSLVICPNSNRTRAYLSLAVYAF
jgi:hypothetical protein